MRFSYAILANPVAGNLNLNDKYRILRDAAKIIGASIYGLDTTSKKEFRECVKIISRKYNIIVAAGGDGTFSDIINSIDLSSNIVGYLPMGTGNALRYALKYPRSPILSAYKIKYGNIHKLDLIKYADKYAFMSSFGFEVEVIKEYKKIKRKNKNSKIAYIKATLKNFIKLKKNQPLSAKVYIDGKEYMIRNAGSIIVTKQPYYGYGMKVMPYARFDDGLLHIGVFSYGIINTMLMIALSFSIGNIMGIYHSAGDAISFYFSEPQDIHIDGDFAGNVSKINFQLMKKSLQITI